MLPRLQPYDERECCRHAAYWVLAVRKTSSRKYRLTSSDVRRSTFAFRRDESSISIFACRSGRACVRLEFNQEIDVAVGPSGLLQHRANTDNCRMRCFRQIEARASGSGTARLADSLGESRRENKSPPGCVPQPRQGGGSKEGPPLAFAFPAKGRKRVAERRSMGMSAAAGASAVEKRERLVDRRPVRRRAGDVRGAQGNRGVPGRCASARKS